MTDSPEVAVEPKPVKASNPIGLVALILAGLGFILAIVPATAWIAWLVIVPAIVLAIIALTRKGKSKGLAIAAIIVAPIAWLIAIIVAVGAGLSGVADAIEDADTPPSAGSEVESSDGEAPAEVGIGDAVTNDDGVAFTVTSMECGLSEAGQNEFLREEAKGEFCEVKFTLDNGSSDAVSVSTSDFTGAIAEATYEANSAVSQFGDDLFATEVNPGLSTDGVVYFDVPVGTPLEFVTYRPFISWGGDVVIKVS